MPIGRKPAYQRSLKQVLRFRRATLVATLLLTVATGWLFSVIPMGFLPNEDAGRLNADTEAAQRTSFAAMKAHQEALAAIVANCQRLSKTARIR